MGQLAEEHWLRVGVSALEVSVPRGTPMAGFAARTEPSAGVHDPLSVRALVIEDMCWITIDVCGLDEVTCLNIRQATPFLTERVIVSATHTHSGPCSMSSRLGQADERLIEIISARAVDAAHMAAATQRLCSVGYEGFSGLGIAHDRRHTSDEIDPELQVLVFRSSVGSIVAWLLQFPCHPVVLGADNLLISGDYPSFARLILEQREPGSVAIFLTGAAGDVNTGHSAESSYSLEVSSRRTFEEAERIGRRLATAGFAASQAALRPQNQLAMATKSIELELEPLDLESPHELAQGWAHKAKSAAPGERAILEIWSDWAHARNRTSQLSWVGTVTVVRLADILLVALPGEPFLEGAEKIKEAFDRPVIVVGYSNGCPGYFPSAAEYDFGGYEVLDAHRYYGMDAPFKRGSLETIVETAVSLGRQLA